MTAVLSAAITNIDEWRALVAHSFNPLEIRSTEDAFAGSLSTVQLSPDVTVSRISHTRSTMTRTHRGIDLGDDDSMFLSLSCVTPFNVRQADRMVGLERGSACFTVSSLPYDLICPDRMEQIVLKIPRAELPVSRSEQMEVLARPFGADHPEMSLLRSVAEGVLESARDLGGATGEILRQTLLDLSALTIQNAVGEASLDRMERTSLYQAMTAFIRTNAHESGLTPQTLADRFHVSRRLVFQLFEENESSPALAIRTERLRRAAFLLASSNAGIGRIARQSGFGDLSTFARVFQREYGALPSEWRSARTAAG